MGIDIITSEYIINNRNLQQSREILKQMDKKNIKFTFITDETYPATLKLIDDAPIGLFYIGNIMLPEYLLAIVGSRRATNYGKTVAYKLSLELSKYNLGIVSGMARGIDTEAHKGALDANGFTVAVLGSGFNNIYPKENIKLMNKIIDNGCVITEYLPDMKPYSFNFPERNRIISGLSKAVLVVEAGINSGSMITVNCALEQGKDVYAVPGDIYREQSKGCNKLIKDGAKLVDSIEDILEELGIRSSISKYNIELDEFEQNIIRCINEGSLTFEQIKLKCNCETSFCYQN
ncbi:DNA-processing protein DprA [Caloramator sp. mosi_1]|uniref:DNA-processing protein DprA n=1 Tax=Caloramator sp. mosi_1 TaxID=3023090 RepID=UPI0023612F65|nr:DNA-processing protein DprA [Caloramator sp. mosi_1]WDC84018.1 DNA-processing protein DprA [Caloramator sp. mosi_1]